MLEAAIEEAERVKRAEEIELVEKHRAATRGGGAEDR
jgi:hypothetical protein